VGVVEALIMDKLVVMVDQEVEAVMLLEVLETHLQLHLHRVMTEVILLLLEIH
tara:strand:- start:442 stop:600 length:159 start_codon:yes stop_codon:yes gene_type:complete